MQNIFLDDPDLVIQDVDFSDTHLVLCVREGESFRLCAIPLPLPSHKVMLNFTINVFH